MPAPDSSADDSAKARQAKPTKRKPKPPSRPRRSSTRSQGASSAIETTLPQPTAAIRKTQDAGCKPDPPEGTKDMLRSSSDTAASTVAATPDPNAEPQQGSATNMASTTTATTTSTPPNNTKRGRKRRKTGVVAVVPRTLPLAASRSNIAVADNGIDSAALGTTTTTTTSPDARTSKSTKVRTKKSTSTNTTTGSVSAAEATRRSPATPLEQVHHTSATDASTTTISGQPRLKQYCSKFRTPRQPRGAKRRKTAANNAAAASTRASAESANTGVATTTAPAASTRVAAGPVVQIVNGEIVLQESSMVVTGTGVAARSGAGTHALDEEDAPVVEEEAQLGGIGSTYSSFAQRQAPQQWSANETRQFYDALRQVGTDFGTMEMLFSSKRTRKMLKTKFRNEQAKQPLLIEAALHPKARSKIGESRTWINMDCLFPLVRRVLATLSHSPHLDVPASYFAGIPFPDTLFFRL
jgi:hypothetical protein